MIIYGYEDLSSRLSVRHFILIIVKALLTASSTYKTFSTQSIFGSLLFLKFLMQIHLQCLF